MRATGAMRSMSYSHHNKMVFTMSGSSHLAVQRVLFVNNDDIFSKITVATAVDKADISIVMYALSTVLVVSPLTF